MVTMRVLLDTVAAVVGCLDEIEFCSRAFLCQLMIKPGGKNMVSMPATECYGIIDKMKRSALITVDNDGAIVAITPKGRALAADIRALTAKAVR
jgi:hypothetical protein